MSELISRRNAIGAAVAGAAMLGASAMLGGCASSSQDTEWDGTSLLPMGTVIKLKDLSEINFVIISRRPLLTRKFTSDSDGSMSVKETDESFDYALYPWPAGRLSDFGSVPSGINNFVANNDQISEIIFMGYKDDQEEKAQGLLEKAKESGANGPAALEEMNAELISRMNGGQ